MQAIIAPAPPPIFWLRTQTNTPGIPEMQTGQTQYGIQVFLLGTETGSFRLTLTTESGTSTITVEKGEMPSLWVVWFAEEQQTVSVTVERLP